MIEILRAGRPQVNECNWGRKNISCHSPLSPMIYNKERGHHAAFIQRHIPSKFSDSGMPTGFSWNVKCRNEKITPLGHLEMELECWIEFAAVVMMRSFITRGGVIFYLATWCWNWLPSWSVLSREETLSTGHRRHELFYWELYTFLSITVTGHFFQSGPDLAWCQY